MNFLERIDELLRIRDLNKNQLAAQTGIPVSTIYGWYKKGYGSITLPTLLKLSEFFGCSMEYLVNGAKDIQKTPSPAALDVARRYDTLSESAQKLISAVVLFESADVPTKNKVISILVDHSNEVLQTTSFASAAAASVQIIDEMTATPAEEAK